MKILVAPNAMKGSLAAHAAARAISTGLKRALRDAEILELPVADGGDGTVAVLVSALGGEIVQTLATDPFGRPNVADWGLVSSERTAVIDSASASGFTTLGADERSPMTATSRGTGELITAALGHDCARIIVGLGGSATVDAGVGALRALGARFLDAGGGEIVEGGGGLAQLHAIDSSSLDLRLKSIELVAAADVDNPLVGLDGAALVYGPQKGATAEQAAQLDSNLRRFAQVVNATTGADVSAMRHAGAAGGIGAALHALGGARLVSGAQVVLDRLNFEQRLDGVDRVITAEGKFDVQTSQGKAPWAVALSAQRAAVPCVIFAGQIDLNGLPRSLPFARVVQINDPSIGVSDAMARAEELLTDAAERYGGALAGT
jgi:glycerate kinase